MGPQSKYVLVGFFSIAFYPFTMFELYILKENIRPDCNLKQSSENKDKQINQIQ